VLVEKCDGLVARWTKRHFLLKDGCLHWDRSALAVSRTGEVSSRSCVDFSKTRCNVLAQEECRVVIKPVCGAKWSRLGQHSRAGTQLAIVLACDGEHRTEVLASMVDHIKAHVAYGLRLRRLRHRLKEHLRTQRLGFKPVPNVQAEGVDEEDCASCAICCEDMFGLNCGPSVIEASCGHRFHAECVIPWALKHASCPLCREAWTPSRAAPAGTNADAQPSPPAPATPPSFGAGRAPQAAQSRFLRPWRA